MLPQKPQEKVKNFLHRNLSNMRPGGQRPSSLSQSKASLNVGSTGLKQFGISNQSYRFNCLRLNELDKSLLCFQWALVKAETEQRQGRKQQNTMIAFLHSGGCSYKHFKNWVTIKWKDPTEKSCSVCITWRVLVASFWLHWIYTMRALLYRHLSTGNPSWEFLMASWVLTARFI